MIRRATKKKDLTIINEIYFDVVQWMKINNLRQWRFKELNLLYSLFDLSDFFLCFNSENKAVGFMILSNYDISHCWYKSNLKGALYLYKLTVKREYAKMGYSKKLLCYAKEYASQRKYNYICLYCLKEHEKLSLFYEENGFKKIFEQTIPSENKLSVFYIYNIK